MIQVFSAKRAPNAFDSDIAVILHPLPRIPMLICYWKPDDGMESSLNVFFDDTAEENLDNRFNLQDCHRDGHDVREDRHHARQVTSREGHR